MYILSHAVTVSSKCGSDKNLHWKESQTELHSTWEYFVAMGTEVQKTNALWRSLNGCPEGTDPRATHRFPGTVERKTGHSIEKKGMENLEYLLLMGWRTMIAYYWGNFLLIACCCGRSWGKSWSISRGWCSRIHRSQHGASCLVSGGPTVDRSHNVLS